MAELRCPMCGRPNPDDLEACQFCDARLKPLTGTPPVDPPHIRAGEKPIKRQTSEFEKVKFGNSPAIHPGEQPTRKDTGELERSLPTWLKSLREGGEQASAESPADASADLNLPVKHKAAPPDESSAESLDWLNGLDSVAAEDDQEFPDWLAGLRSSSTPASEPVEPTPSEPKESQPEPDWMSRLGNLEAAQPPSVPLEKTGGSAPDWLSRLGADPGKSRPAKATAFESPAGGEPIEKPVAEPTPAENLPDWLEALKPKAAPLEETPAAGKEDVPDWLSSLPAIPVEKPSAAPGAEPDWLNNLREKAVKPAPEEIPAQPDFGAETPDWLSRLSAKSGATAASAFIGEPSSPRDSSAEVPDWLSQLKSDVSEASKAEKHAEEFEPATESFPADKSAEPIPDWLSAVDQAVAPSAGTPALVMADGSGSSTEPAPAAFSLETPEWLSKLRPDRKVEIPALNPDESEPESLETAELPSWVQAMRPVESVIADSGSSAPDETSAAEASGPLAGLRGVLPASPGLGAMRKPPAYTVKLQANNNQQRYAAQLERMVMEEGQARGRKPPRLISNRVWRLVISIVLITAILFPLVNGGQFTPDMSLYPSEWEGTSILLNEFRADTPMLLVFDYEPALSGELEASAAAVIDHILFLGTRLALISTTPTGPALAEQFLESTQKYHLETGLQYTNLGYLPGGPAGIQLFAADPITAVELNVEGDPAWVTPALQGVYRLSDFAAVIILTDNADTGRLWIEQTRSAIGETPMLMIISAQAEPMIRPYYDSGQIQGLVTGLLGGKAYEQTYATPGLARRYWDSFGFGTLAAVILIAIGSAWGSLMAWRTRKKT